MSESVTDDPEFWRNAGFDYSRKEWSNYDTISIADMDELGKIFVQSGPDAAASHARGLEAKYPDLARM